MLNHYHFIGIAGIGMSALAHLMLKRGAYVTGSDPAINSLKESLIGLGATITGLPDTAAITLDTKVVYSSDIPASHPELIYGRSIGCQVLHRAELLAELAASAMCSLAVTGTHGKTTTTAFLAAILQAAARDPSYAIGGLLLPEGNNSSCGTGPDFVFEADESDGSMLRYSPYGAIITNIDTDHLQHYGSIEALEQAIRSFASQVQSEQHLIWCGDDVRLGALQLGGRSYGISSHCDYVVCNIKQKGWMTNFDLKSQHTHLKDLVINLPGKHLAMNAAAAAALALELGVEADAIRCGLAAMQGIKRRAERLAEVSGVCVVDDYAHHPAAIKATLESIRGAYPEQRLIAVYQPHRYSRIGSLPENAFRFAFNAVDLVFVTDIYSAGEAPTADFSKDNFYSALAKQSLASVRYVAKEDLLASLAAELRPFDRVVFMGAGDITRYSSSLVELLKTQPPRQWRIGLAFGGPSPEHAISLRSARFVINAMAPKLYNIDLFGVTRSGEWLADPEALEILTHAVEQPLASELTASLNTETLAALQKCDLFFPVMHGPYGEDGIVQAFFEVLGKPYVGCSHRSAALCMDKAASKKVVSHHNVATAPFVHFHVDRWHADKESILAAIQEELSFPVIIKPVHIGSSIGLGTARNLSELQSAIEEACQVDDEVIVEKRLHARDIEFAILGHSYITVLPPGEVITNGKPYDYLDKVGDQGPPTTPLADLPQEWLERGMEAARKAYEACGCQGWARVDFLLDSDGVFWFNEVNPIPGMTAISLYPQMCQQQGIAPDELVKRLVIHALARHRAKQRRNNYVPSLVPVI
jgi:UDP-N-acetylmuramate--alanine ligase